MQESIITVSKLDKRYQGGFQALQDIHLEVKKGEIFALLGPNGAGKTTLIGIICGLIRPSSGHILVGGYDIKKNYRQSRALIGLVPQELNTDMFETVWDSVCFTRGLFGKAPDPNYIEQTLKKLSLWDKKDNKILSLSGGMKRRLLIAKALSHEPQVLFLDEPTAGVDVELRKQMWAEVQALQESGVTIILTTHYIEEAEEMADRIGVINQGRLILTEDKTSLMRKLGSKQIHIHLRNKLEQIPPSLAQSNLQLSQEGKTLIYSYDECQKNNGVEKLMKSICQLGLSYQDLHSQQNSLEEIFVKLVQEEKNL